MAIPITDVRIGLPGPHATRGLLCHADAAIGGVRVRGFSLWIERGRYVVMMPQRKRRYPCRACRRTVGYDCRFCPCCGAQLHESLAGLDGAHNHVDVVELDPRTRFELLRTLYDAYAEAARVGGSEVA